MSLQRKNNAAAGGDDEADEWRVHVYRPEESPAAAERRVKTELFLCLLLTLPRAQDWRDMLTAALRAGTWRPHHLDAVLRGVLLNKYNEPRAFLTSCGGLPLQDSGHSAALREAAAQAAQTAPVASTPTSRLHRARDVLVFCAEEGVLYSPAAVVEKKEAASAAAAVDSSPSSETRAAATTPNTFTPSPDAVHHLLAMLLQAAQRSTDATAPTPPARTATALPTASFSGVWHFLAWMELHGYHVLSPAVLDALETAVDDGGTPAASASSTSSASGEGVSYAAVSQRIHRLDYLRGERALLRASAQASAQLGRGGGDLRHRRQRDTPRTDPLE